MSKSLNNFFTIREVLQKYPAEVVRFFLVASHYRSFINYSEETLQIGYDALERFYHALKGLDTNAVVPAADSVYEQRFHAAMQDDFNTPEAIGVLFELVREINRLRNTDAVQATCLAALLRKLGSVLGLLQANAEEFLRNGGAVDAALVESLIAERNAARAAKNWAEADRTRDQLKALSVVVEDKNGVTSWRIER
jgi:cysteinyl-tRNA synthetase